VKTSSRIKDPSKIPATLAEPNCPFGLVGGSSILTGEHGTGLESKIPIYDAAARLTESSLRSLPIPRKRRKRR